MSNAFQKFLQEILNLLETATISFIFQMVVFISSDYSFFETIYFPHKADETINYATNKIYELSPSLRLGELCSVFDSRFLFFRSIAFALLFKSIGGQGLLTLLFAHILVFDEMIINTTLQNPSFIFQMILLFLAIIASDHGMKKFSFSISVFLTFMSIDLHPSILLVTNDIKKILLYYLIIAINYFCIHNPKIGISDFSSGLTLLFDELFIRPHNLAILTLFIPFVISIFIQKSWISLVPQLLTLLLIALSPIHSYVDPMVNRANWILIVFFLVSARSICRSNLMIFSLIHSGVVVIYFYSNPIQTLYLKN